MPGLSMPSFAMNVFNNRVAGQTRVQPRFGAASNITDVTPKNFDQEVMQASVNQDVVVKFYADWCGPCQAYAPEFDSFASNNTQVKSAAFNIGPKGAATREQKVLMGKYKVFGIPTTLLFRQGKLAGRINGPTNQVAVEQMVKNAP